MAINKMMWMEFLQWMIYQNNEMRALCYDLKK